VSAFTPQYFTLQAQERYRAQCEAQREASEKLKRELAKLQADNAGLQHKVAREHEIRVAAQGEKLRLEREIEMDSERHFNSCSSRSSLSLPGSPSVAASAPTMPYPNLHLPPGSYGTTFASLGKLSPQASFTLSAPGPPSPKLAALSPARMH